jgi:hypothetical protein
MSVKNSGFNINAPAAPTYTQLQISGGSLDASFAYDYALTYATAYGETDFRENITSVTTGATNPAVAVTAIPVPTTNNVISKKLYRNTSDATTTFKLVATLARGVISYNDKTADADLGAQAPEGNTGSSRQVMDGYIKFENPNIYSVTNVAVNSAITSNFTVFDSGAAEDYTADLPTLNADLVGVKIVVLNKGTGTVTISPFTGQQINSVVDGTFVIGTTTDE